MYILAHVTFEICGAVVADGDWDVVDVCYAARKKGLGAHVQHALFGRQ